MNVDYGFYILNNSGLFGIEFMKEFDKLINEHNSNYVIAIPIINKQIEYINPSLLLKRDDPELYVQGLKAYTEEQLKTREYIAYFRLFDRKIMKLIEIADITKDEITEITWDGKHLEFYNRSYNDVIKHEGVGIWIDKKNFIFKEIWGNETFTYICEWIEDRLTSEIKLRKELHQF